MKLETVSISELKLLEKNVRYHTDVEVKEFARSLKQYGQTRPFVIDEDNNVLIGNCMLMAMKSINQETATAYRISGLSPAKKKKLILSDNRIYSLGGDNANIIEDYIREIASLDDLDIPGFDESCLQELIRDAKEIEQSVMNYGVMPDTVLDNHNQKHDIASTATNISQNSPQNTNNPDIQSQPTEIVKTVICPNCGEVIRI